MNDKKLIPPIIITILLIGYFCFYIFGALNISDHIGFRLVGILIALVMIFYAISTLLDRIKEIRSGEDDDIGKY